MRVLYRARAGTIKCMDRPIDQPESPFEILRRLENIARVGTIAEVRTGRPARCRIRCGNITTNWIPWIAGRAAGEAGSVWWPPKVGEQCLMLAPGGDLMNAMVLPGGYSDANPQVSENPDLFRMEFGGAGYMEHDATSGEFTLSAITSILLRVMESSIQITPDAIVMKAGGATATLNGEGLKATPDVLAQDISLVNHLHPGVKRGGEETDPPV